MEPWSDELEEARWDVRNLIRDGQLWFGLFSIAAFFMALIFTLMWFMGE